jgi:hypothetical protein
LACAFIFSKQDIYLKSKCFCAAAIELFQNPIIRVYHTTSMNSKKTKTGDLVQAHEYKDNDATFGIITIRLKNGFPELQLAEPVLSEFMQQLQPTFAVQHTTGRIVDYELQQAKMVVTDYWRDVEGTDWKVKGWTDGKTMAVLYIKNIAQVPVEKESFFLNGVLFGRM